MNGDLRATLVEFNVGTLALERCVPVARWLGGNDAVVPAALVGQPGRTRSRARPELATPPWASRGTGSASGAGIGITRAHAYIVDDTIVAVEASVAIATSTHDDIARHIRTLHGPPISFEFNLGTAYVTIGSVPETRA